MNPPPLASSGDIARAVGAAFFGVVVLVGGLLATPAFAAEPTDVEAQSDAPLRLQGELYAGTRVPVHVGVGGSLAFRQRFRLHTEIGFLPGAYVDGINSVVQAFDGYDDATAKLIEIATSDALVLHLGAHVRPVRRLGLYLGTGYTLVTLGGSATGEELIEDVLGGELPTGSTGERDIDVGSTLHNLEFSLGWSFALPKKWTLRTELGLLWCASARANVQVDGERPGTDSLERATEAYLVETYETYVISPTLALWVGRTF